MSIEATNNFVFIIRDEIQKEKGGMIIPGQGRVKPNKGTIFSVGELTEDKKIKQGKTAIFHAGIGFEIDYEGTVYLVLMDKEVIGIV